MSRSQDTQSFNQGTANATQDQNNAQQALKTNQGREQALFDQNQEQFGTAKKALDDQYAHPGYDSGTQTAIVSSGQNANNAAFDALNTEAKDRATTTRNDASQNALLDDLARKRGEGSSDAAMKAQIGIGDAALQDKEKAITGMAGLYGEGNQAFGTVGGVGNSTYGATLGAGNDELGTAVRASGQNRSFGDTFGTALASSLGNGLGSMVTPSLNPIKAGPVTFGG